MMTVRHSLRLVDEGGPDPDFAQDRLDRVFFALSDPVRRQILERLDGQALLVSELAAPFEISLQAVSRHIQVLVRAGLIQQERTGRISRCSLDAGPLLDAAVWMNRYSKYWQQQFDLLADLFGKRSQLIVYHFMYGPDWEIGCRSCSFWADNFNGITPHLNARDVSLVAVSRAPLQKLQAQARRFGWTFKWVSSSGNDFNFDYNVSFSPQTLARGEALYNYTMQKMSDDTTELPGISAFFKDGDQIFHSYSTYARGLDMLNAAYHYLDIAPKGRDEDGLPFPMDWVRHRVAYES